MYHIPSLMIISKILILLILNVIKLLINYRMDQTQILKLILQLVLLLFQLFQLKKTTHSL